MRADFVLGYEIFGRAVVLRGEYSRGASAERRARFARWVGVMQGLVDGEKVRGHPVRVVEGRDGGWVEGVLRGLEELRKGGVSGQKLVVRVGEE